MDVGAPLVADAQAAVLVEPSDRALDDPALTLLPEAVGALGQAILPAIPRRLSSRRAAREW